MPLVVFMLALLLVGAGDPTAVLQIQSQPGVEVLWEGVVLGEADPEGLLVIEGIPPGRYQLTLRAAGFAQRDLEVTVTAGERTNLELPLQALAVRSPIAPSLESPVDPPDAGAEQPSMADVMPAGPRGIESRPADVTVDGGPEAGPDPLAAPPSRETQLEQVDTLSGGQDQGLSRPLWPMTMVLLLVVLAGVVWVWLSPRKAAAGSPSREKPLAEDQGLPLFEADLGDLDTGSPAFLEDLKRREQNLENVRERGTAPAEPMIIEIEATEVRRVDNA